MLRGFAEKRKVEQGFRGRGAEPYTGQNSGHDRTEV